METALLSCEAVSKIPSCDCDPSPNRKTVTESGNHRMSIRMYPLCTEEKPLRDSHFLPAALGDFCRPRDGHAIVVSPEIIIESDRMLHDYVSCDDCEDIFNKGGEN